MSSVVPVYFNEINPTLGQWLQNLWPRSIVDTRDIKAVRAKDLSEFTRCHFFAGIGAWEYALYLAGWPTDRPVWTASCPCQPFSCAGKMKGEEDERHLWPFMFRRIKKFRPPTVFGEQVASKAACGWLDGVRNDMESLGYAFAAANLPSASVGAPHIRQRIWWVASSGLGNAHSNECNDPVRREAKKVKRRSHDKKHPKRRRARKLTRASASSAIVGHSLNAWENYQLIPCGEKLRRVESGSLPLAYGIPSRVEQLRAYGNSNCPQLGAVFIRAFLESENELRSNTL